MFIKKIIHRVNALPEFSVETAYFSLALGALGALAFSVTVSAAPDLAVSYSTELMMNTSLGSAYANAEFDWDRSIAIDLEGNGRDTLIVSSFQGFYEDTSNGLIAFGLENDMLVDKTLSVFPSVVKTAVLRNFIKADFNGDGHNDLFLNNHGTEAYDPPRPGEQNRLLISNGLGSLVDRTAWLPQKTDFSHGSVAADLDLDGDIDLFVNNLTDDDEHVSYLAFNDGDGKFQHTEDWDSSRFSLGYQDTWLGGTYNSAAIDVGNDGDIDLYHGAIEYWDDGVTLAGYGYLENDGTGTFELTESDDFTWPGSNQKKAEYLDTADLDNDGDQDLIAYASLPGDATVFQYLRNDGASGFTNVSSLIEGMADNSLPESGGTPQFALHDIDIDGDVDLVFKRWTADFTGQVVLVFINDGSGRLEQADPATLPIPQHSYVFQYLDLNGDWIPDVTYVTGWPEFSLAARLGSIPHIVQRSGWKTADRIAGGSAGDILSGLAGDDQLKGNGGNDLLLGGPGNDLLIGDAGSDTLSGGPGNDTLLGGSGNDEYIYASDDLAGSDTLHDDEGRDRLVFEGLESSEVESVSQGPGGDLMLHLSSGGQITVKGHFSSERAGIDSIFFADGMGGELSHDPRFLAGAIDTLIVPEVSSGLNIMLIKAAMDAAEASPP